MPTKITIQLLNCFISTNATPRRCGIHNEKIQLLFVYTFYWHPNMTSIRMRSIWRSTRMFQLIVQMYGFWPYHIVDQRVESTLFLRLYTLLAPIFFIGAMFYSSSQVLVNTGVQYNTDAGNLIQSMFTVSCSVMFWMGYIISYWHRNEIAHHLIPQIIRFYNHIQHRTQFKTAWTNVAHVDLLFKLYFKNIIIPVIVIAGEMVKLEYYAPEAQGKSVYKFFMVLPFWIFAVLPNLFAYTMLGVTLAYRRINAEIQQLVEEQIQLQQPPQFDLKDVNSESTRYGRMKKFCELSDRLDEMSILHMELGRITKQVNRIISTFLFIWCWHRMTYLIAQLFFAYQVACFILSEIQLNTRGGSNVANEELNWEMVAVCIGAGMLILIDFYLLANICFQTETEVGLLFFFIDS